MNATSKIARTSLAIAVVLGISFSLGGCAAEPAVNDGGAGKSQTDQGATSDGADKAPRNEVNSHGFVDKKGEVPDWVADGFPIYPGSVFYAGSESHGTQILGFSVSDADEQTIYKWLVEKYSQDGWQARNFDEVSSDFDAIHADGREAYINVTQSSFVMTAKQV